MIINKANLSALFTGYKANFQDAFAQAQPEWSQFATQVPSSTSSNLYPFLGEFPQLREWIGDRQVKNLAAHDYTITNKTYEGTVDVSRESIEDDEYNVYGPAFQGMGYAAATHPDEVLYTLLAAGASELCYDGQFFFDTDHPTPGMSSSTTANYDSTGGGNLWMLLDTRRPLKPMIYQQRREYAFKYFTSPNDESVFTTNKFKFGVDGRMNGGFGLWQLAYGSLNTINSTNFETYVTAMMGLKSDEGRPLSVRPNILLCGPSNWSAARDLFETQFLASGATNPNYQAVKVMVTPYLT
jgi:phage major head subunit gpT-like protein